MGLTPGKKSLGQRCWALSPMGGREGVGTRLGLGSQVSCRQVAAGAVADHKGILGQPRSTAVRVLGSVGSFLRASAVGRGSLCAPKLLQLPWQTETSCGPHGLG